MCSSNDINMSSFSHSTKNDKQAVGMLIVFEYQWSFFISTMEKSSNTSANKGKREVPTQTILCD